KHIFFFNDTATTDIYPPSLTTLFRSQGVLDGRRELRGGRAHEVDVVGRIGARGAGGYGHHAEQPALGLEGGGQDGAQPFGAGQRQRRRVGREVFDHRRLLAAGDESDDAFLVQGRDGA